MSTARHGRLQTRPARSGRRLRTRIALVLAVVMALLPVAHAIAAITVGDAVTGRLGGAEHRQHHSDHGHSHDDDEPSATGTHWLAGPWLAEHWLAGHWVAGHWHGHDHGSGVDHAHELASAQASVEFRSIPMNYRMEWRTPRDLRAAFDLEAGLERPPRGA